MKVERVYIVLSTVAIILLWSVNPSLTSALAAVLFVVYSLYKADLSNVLP